jgi:hypothetical protein
MIPDPFAVIEPGFEPWQGHPDAELSQPDLTARSLKEWLRSDEATKAISKSQPPARHMPYRTDGRLPHITGFPDRR